MTCLLNFIVKRKQLFLLKFQNILIMLIGRQDPEWGGGGYSFIWAIRGRAAG